MTGPISLTIAADTAPGPWDALAACGGRSVLMDPAPELVPVNQPAALALCQSCPVLDDCRRWVLALAPSDDPGGVCGGLTPPERDTLRAPAASGAFTPGTKWCNRCQQTKPLDEFYRDSRTADGRNAYCKPCNCALKANARARKTSPATTPHHTTRKDTE